MRRTTMIAVLTGGIALMASFVGSVLHAQSPSKSVWDGVYTEEQEQRGLDIYEENCLACHGPQLEGGEMAPGLADGAFKANWNGLTVGDLYNRIRETMPPDRPGSIGRQEIADVLAHILFANGMPAGEKELARRPEMLKMIRFDSYKPDP
jgi:mono/diheme cytochrome c family protein